MKSFFILSVAASLAVAAPSIKPAGVTGPRIYNKFSDAHLSVHKRECTSFPDGPDPDVLVRIYKVAKQRGVSDRVMLAMFETCQVETGCNNLPCGDKDSIGVFQQRPSQNWGSYDQIMNVEYSVGKYLDGAIAKDQEEGPDVTAGQLAQMVQISERPDRYEEEKDAGQKLWDQAKQLAGTDETPAPTPTPTPTPTPGGGGSSGDDDDDEDCDDDEGDAPTTTSQAPQPTQTPSDPEDDDDCDDDDDEPTPTTSTAPQPTQTPSDPEDDDDCDDDDDEPSTTSSAPVPTPTDDQGDDEDCDDDEPTTTSPAPQPTQTPDDGDDEDCDDDDGDDDEPVVSTSSSASSPAPTANTCTKTYTPKAGDICSKVASSAGISLDDFYKWNPQLDDECQNLEVGQEYCVKH